MLNYFIESLPAYPLATDDFSTGLRRLEKREALLKRYIQLNPARLIRHVAFDVDHDCAAVADIEGLLPPAGLIALNPGNGRGHLIYPLRDPVAFSEAAHVAPLRYLSAIERGFVRRLEADAGYAGRIIKNPAHPYWRVVRRQFRPYELHDLRSALHWHNMRPFDRPPTGWGRNCDLFEATRHAAYVDIRSATSSEAFHRRVFALALQVNLGFDPPLSIAEVRATSRSVARWVLARFSTDGFSQIQTERGRKSGESRRAARDRIVADIRAMKGPISDKVHGHSVSSNNFRNRGEQVRAYAEAHGRAPRSIRRYLQDIAPLTTAAPWKDEGISRATWYRRRRKRDENGGDQGL